MTHRDQFIVRPGGRVKLAAIDPGFTGAHESRESTQGEIDALGKRLAELQYRMYAESKRSLLICLQAMDASGKDGVVTHVLGAMNPQGCTVVGFKQPSAEEAAHDFLWRVHKACPEKGHAAVFNRSHYEDVLVVRVHKLVPEEVWSKRYEHINRFEKLLSDSGTHILKFYLHISKDEQLERFKQRIDNPAKHWKISDSDYRERERWGDYTAAYEDALSRCSTEHAPWFVIPANHKWFRNLAVSQILVEALDELRMTFPEPTVDMAEIRRKYHEAKGG